MSTITPSQKYEKKLWESGKLSVAGIDEAGRGPLAGPVVSAAVVFDPDALPIDGIDDSKKLTAKKRELLYDKIISEAKAVGIGIVEASEIDRIGILPATYKSMRMAVGRLRLKVDHLLIDGRPLPDKIYPQTAVIKGDSKCYSIAAASIVAKVYRDRLMGEYNTVFPGYGFSKHKGYGTKQHLAAIEKLQPCPIHRKTFKKVKEHIVNLEEVNNTRKLGKYGEDIAAYYLYKKGFKILERNFRIGSYGEIDIIAEKGSNLCFVEVKTQRHQVFGPPESWIDEHKMRQIGMIAEGYLSQNPEIDKNCRFDAVVISIINNDTRIRHIENAFML